MYIDNEFTIMGIDSKGVSFNWFYNGCHWRQEQEVVRSNLALVKYFCFNN